MAPVRFVLLNFALFLGVSALGSRNDEEKEAAQKPNRRDGAAANVIGGVLEGMTAAEVKNLHGKPQKIARQILFRRHVEQWTYNEPIGLRIELQALRGQEARVVSVHSLRSKKP